jgi:protein SCO1
MAAAKSLKCPTFSAPAATKSAPTRTRTARVAICIALAFLVLATAACAHRPALHGTALVPPPLAQDFSLSDQYGKPYSLAQSRGHTVALYFGFAHCDDVCPQTLALLGKAREAAGLTPHDARIVMVTVDPARDSAKALQAFIRKVGVQATALRGSPAQLRPIYRAYGVVVKPQKNDIVHTDTIFLIDGKGHIREILDPQTPLNDVAADLRAIVD